MKMFWPVVLFCGFVSLSVGEGCMQGALRIDKEKLEEIVSVALAARIADKLTDLLQQPSGGTKSDSSSSRKTCTIEQPPKVHISKGPGTELIARVEISLKVTIEDAVAGVVQRTVIEFQKNCNLIIAVRSDGFIVKDCHCSPSDGNVTMSLQGGLTLPKTATEKVKEAVCSVIDQEFCGVVKQCIEQLSGSMPSQVLGHFEKADFHVKSMEEDGKYIIYCLNMKMGGKDPEAQHCPDSSNSSSSCKPHCEMSDGTLFDIKILSMEPLQGEKTKMEFGNFNMTEDGQGMSYDVLMTCEDEDPNKCDEHSSGTCTVQLKMENEENKIKISPDSEGCDQEMDSDQARRDHKSMCQMANCKLAEKMEDLVIPTLGNVASLVSFKAGICKGEMIVSAILS